MQYGRIDVSPPRETPYRPANGTEGSDFESRWCERCEAEAAHREDEDAPGCAILGAALFGEQPAQWVRRDGAPRCTAFRTEGVPERCPYTIDMFEVPA